MPFIVSGKTERGAAVSIVVTDETAVADKLKELKDDGIADVSVKDMDCKEVDLDRFIT